MQECWRSHGGLSSSKSWMSFQECSCTVLVACSFLTPPLPALLRSLEFALAELCSLVRVVLPNACLLLVALIECCTSFCCSASWVLHRFVWCVHRPGCGMVRGSRPAALGACDQPALGIEPESAGVPGCWAIVLGLIACFDLFLYSLVV